MAKVRVVLYKERGDRVPVAEWLDGLPIKVRDKCAARINRLMSLGHQLHRPDADYLRDGIYELRVRFRRVNYRMLYFFHGNEAVVLTHGLTKEREVPIVEIEKALELKRRYETDPESHSFAWSR